jgi:hypothetical protein
VQCVCVCVCWCVPQTCNCLTSFTNSCQETADLEMSAAGGVLVGRTAGLCLCRALHSSMLLDCLRTMHLVRGRGTSSLWSAFTFSEKCTDDGAREAISVLEELDASPLSDVAAGLASSSPSSFCIAVNAPS